MRAKLTGKSCMAVALGLVAACVLWPAAVQGQEPPQGALRVAELACTENDPLIEAVFDVVREAYRRIGMDAVERTLPGERSVQAVNAGEYTGDVMHIAGLELRYPNLVRAPVPVAYTDMVLVARTDWHTRRPPTGPRWRLIPCVSGAASRRSSKPRRACPASPA